jgi:hypothetical protein
VHHRSATYPNAPAGVGGGVLETKGFAPSGAQVLSGCSADWSGTFTNIVGVNDQIYDITGYLRELTFTTISTR